ncbi:MAG: hypothetical protein ACR2NQ_01610 [Thermodesulfobacteriota bacterium]
MSNSIYHFFKDILEKKDRFQKTAKLEDFSYSEELLSCENKGKFPDLAIRINVDGTLFTGGELIELKDATSHTISSFNSTIPTGRKKILKVVGEGDSKIRNQMENAGDCVDSLPEREVYYLVRGRKNSGQKIALVHGSFFETVKVDQLISQSFSQVLEDSARDKENEISQEERERISSLFSKQESFSKVRTVEKASVKLRFRIMTEVQKEGNLLDSKQYPQILDDTLNFVVPLHKNSEIQNINQKAKSVFNPEQLSSMERFKIKHHFNGYFFAFQLGL